MAYFTYSRPVADGVFGRAFGFSFGEIFARLISWNDQRVTVNELSKLSNRELDDIGLTRADIANLSFNRR